MLYFIKFSYVYDIKTNILISHRSVEVDFVICIDVLSAFTISVSLPLLADSGHTLNQVEWDHFG